MVHNIKTKKKKSEARRCSKDLLLGDRRDRAKEAAFPNGRPRREGIGLNLVLTVPTTSASGRERHHGKSSAVGRETIE